jgi:hypothetical protein
MPRRLKYGRICGFPDGEIVCRDFMLLQVSGDSSPFEFAENDFDNPFLGGNAPIRFVNVGYAVVRLIFQLVH